MVAAGSGEVVAQSLEPPRRIVGEAAPQRLAVGGHRLVERQLISIMSRNCAAVGEAIARECY